MMVYMQRAVKTMQQAIQVRLKSAFVQWDDWLASVSGFTPLMVTRAGMEGFIFYRVAYKAFLKVGKAVMLAEVWWFVALYLRLS
jgi:hypothetical protein